MSHPKRQRLTRAHSREKHTSAALRSWKRSEFSSSRRVFAVSKVDSTSSVRSFTSCRSPWS
jgi:hypothetical protein